jgi:hypothetical protein
MTRKKTQKTEINVQKNVREVIKGTIDDIKKTGALGSTYEQIKNKSNSTININNIKNGGCLLEASIFLLNTLNAYLNLINQEDNKQNYLETYKNKINLFNETSIGEHKNKNQIEANIKESNEIFSKIQEKINKKNSTASSHDCSNLDSDSVLAHVKKMIGEMISKLWDTQHSGFFLREKDQQKCLEDISLAASALLLYALVFPDDADQASTQKALDSLALIDRHMKVDISDEFFGLCHSMDRSWTPLSSSQSQRCESEDMGAFLTATTLAHYQTKQNKFINIFTLYSNSLMCKFWNQENKFFIWHKDDNETINWSNSFVGQALALSKLLRISATERTKIIEIITDLTTTLHRKLGRPISRSNLDLFHKNSFSIANSLIFYMLAEKNIQLDHSGRQISSSIDFLKKMQRPDGSFFSKYHYEEESQEDINGDIDELRCETVESLRSNGAILLSLAIAHHLHFSEGDISIVLKKSAQFIMGKTQDGVAHFRPGNQKGMDLASQSWVIMGLTAYAYCIKPTFG